MITKLPEVPLKGVQLNESSTNENIDSMPERRAKLGRLMDSERNQPDVYHNQYDNLPNANKTTNRGDGVPHPARTESFESFQHRDSTFSKQNPLLNRDIQNIVHLSVDKPSGRMPPIRLDHNGQRELSSASYLGSPHD